MFRRKTLRVVEIAKLDATLSDLFLCLVTDERRRHVTRFEWGTATTELGDLSWLGRTVARLRDGEDDEAIVRCGPLLVRLGLDATRRRVSVSVASRRPRHEEVTRLRRALEERFLGSLA